ncbi:leucine-rich repeat protein FLOR 1-like [Carex rostrata]
MSMIFLLLLIPYCIFPVLSAQDDGLVLLKIKEQLNTTEYLSSWVEGFNFCNGSGNNATHVYIDCTSTGRVRTLILSNFYFFHISTPFPEAICDLTELEFLSMDHFYVSSGQFPSCFNKLVNLQKIFMYKTVFYSTVPEFLNNKNLTRIEISSSGLYGPIPPSLSALPNLETLDLSWNFLNGTIPAELAHNPPAYLTLRENQMWGQLPRCWGNYVSIDLSHNYFSGDASVLFGKQNTVTYIDLKFNHFEFNLSNVVFPEKLTKLDLSYNKIYGNVPESLNRHAMLNLDLSNNGLCGEIPQGGNISLYPSAVFEYNPCLCGTPLPPCSNLAPAPTP